MEPCTTDDLTTLREGVEKKREQADFLGLVAILKVLKTKQVTTETLKNSKMGKLINQLASMSSPGTPDEKETAEIATHLLKEWKEVVKKEKAGKRGSSS
jgi:hypothetical protein